MALSVSENGVYKCIIACAKQNRQWSNGVKFYPACIPNAPLCVSRIGEALNLPPFDEGKVSIRTELIMHVCKS